MPFFPFSITPLPKLFATEFKEVFTLSLKTPAMVMVALSRVSIGKVFKENSNTRQSLIYLPWLPGAVS